MTSSKQKKELTTRQQLEQLHVQLAGCSVAALGGTGDVAKQGDYGWSPAYQDVLELRRKYEQLLKALPDPVKLRALADWLDIDDAKKGCKEDEVQQDLRGWAKLAETVRQNLQP